MSNELKHADVICHMAKHGFASVEGFEPKEQDWFHGTGLWNPFTRDDVEWRIKPATITYTVTVPVPMREKPKDGEYYWSIVGGRVYAYQCVCDLTDLSRFQAGNCWSTEADAQAAFDAIFGPLKASKS